MLVTLVTCGGLGDRAGRQGQATMHRGALLYGTSSVMLATVVHSVT